MRLFWILTVTLQFETPVPKASKRFWGTSQPRMSKIFQRTPTETESGMEIHRFAQTIKKYALGQHIHVINFQYLKVVHSKKGFWILKFATIIYTKKEGATVQIHYCKLQLLVLTTKTGS